MNYKKAFFLLLISATVAIIAVRFKPTIKHNLYAIRSVEDIQQLFAIQPSAIEPMAKAYMDEVSREIEKIKQISDQERTFLNTAKSLDSILSLSDLDIFVKVIYTFKYLHPDEAMRNETQKTISDIQAFLVDAMSDKELYQVFKAYVEGNASHEQLTDEQRYYLDETMKGFKRAGLELPDDILQQVKEVKKELTDLSLAFEKNIDTDTSTITVNRADLAGLEDDFIDSLKRTQDGDYILGVDYPTVFNVLDNATCQNTRKRLYIAFKNRAYPANEEVLKDFIQKRDELAKLLGYESYAHYDLEEQMVGSVQRAEAFLNKLLKKADLKEQKEFEQLARDLPPSVKLTKEGTFYPWDVSFTHQHFKKKQFDIDEREIAEYFPVEKTIEGLLSIYEQFFSLRFKQQPITNLWSDDVRLLQVFDAQTDQLLGYILLDLFPRENKFSHAAHLNIIPATYDAQGDPTVALSILMANLPKAHGDKPPLFKRQDVNTFFHEFGHALHALLGRTTLASFAGTSVKRDFVEMPSQMLEEWLWDKEILKMISGHYETGEPLPDQLIERILQLKHLSTGRYIQGQYVYAQVSLDYFAPGAQKDIDQIYRNIARRTIKHVYYPPEIHSFASFGHLTGYGPKYYGYLWSKVFALDLFYEIKKYGLLNSEIGKKYRNEVIGKGGSVNPNILLIFFLGREPNEEAFFKDMGL